MPSTNSPGPCMDQCNGDLLAVMPYSLHRRTAQVFTGEAARSLRAFALCLWGTCEDKTIALGARSGIHTADPLRSSLHYSWRGPSWPVHLESLFPTFFHVSVAKNSVFSQKHKTLKWAFKETLAVSVSPGQAVQDGWFLVPDPAAVT